MRGQHVPATLQILLSQGIAKATRGANQEQLLLWLPQ